MPLDTAKGFFGGLEKENDLESNSNNQNNKNNTIFGTKASIP